MILLFVQSTPSKFVDIIESVDRKFLIVLSCLKYIWYRRNGVSRGKLQETIADGSSTAAITCLLEPIINTKIVLFSQPSGDSKE